MATNLKYKVGDTVTVLKARLHEDLIGQEMKVLHVGPWKAGEMQPMGTYANYPADYVLDDADGGINVREENLV